MKKIYWILTVLALIILAVNFRILIPAGVFTSIRPHFDGKDLKIYDNVSGPEDLDIDYQDQILFISSTDRRTKGGKDGIYMLNLSNLEDQPRLVPLDLKEDFHPHGISCFRQDSILFLYVINHNDQGDFVELFEFKNDSLYTKDRFADDLMVSPNDIIGISTREFYITNDHSSSDSFQTLKEDYLRLANRNIVHFKNGKYQEVAENLAMPNGINVNHELDILYCATTLGQELVTYQRNKSSGELNEIGRANLKSGLDNIDIDNDGNIWIGSHPKLFDFVGHAKDENKTSPSQIFKLIPKDKLGEYIVQEVFMDNGNLISGSSVGVVHNNDLFIGVVFEKKILKGTMN